VPYSLPICMTCKSAIEQNDTKIKCKDCHKLLHSDCSDDGKHCVDCLNGRYENDRY
jgi:hypothetical protein